MIRAIEINAPSNYIDEFNNPLFAIYDLNRMNIFVGENNSGKSRFIRTALLGKTSIPITDTLSNDFKHGFDNSLSNILNIWRYIKQDQNIKDIPFDESIIKASKDSDDYYEIYKHITEAVHIWFNGVQKDRTTQDYYSQLNSHIVGLSQALRAKSDAYGIQKPITEIYKNKCFYIPVLRGIENFDSYFDKTSLTPLNDALLNKKQWRAVDNYANNSKQIYQNKISVAYGIDKSCVFTAENLYEEIRDKLLGEESRRQQVKDFQDFISETFYGGDGFTIIPRQQKNAQEITKEFLSVKIGQSPERPIYDLGDGIKQMITILYKVFERKDDEAIFFIEEPEINLHPGYQRKLMQILQSDTFSKHQFFIVTHSSHIIESSLANTKISIYKTINLNKKNSQFKIIKTTNHDLEILELLGISNGSVFMANCLIFVEGISDKIIIQKYLEVYMQEKNFDFREDVHYAFAETGGGNIAHWDFLKDINDEDIATIHASSFSNRSFIICDNDGNKKKERKEKLKQMVGEQYFYELPVREIENTIKRDVLERTLFNSGEIRLKKQYNESNNSGYYNQNRIGKFIDSHYDLEKKYSSASGSIKNKIQFAKDVVSNISTINDLSETSIELCKILTNYIQAANKR